MINTKVGNIEVFGIIYYIRNTINNKYYVGQTTQGIQKRYHGDFCKYTACEKLKKEIEKYGEENFIINNKVDVAFSREELDIKERIYISIYKADVPGKGYNSSSGGKKGYTYNVETKNKISESMTKEKRLKISKYNKELWKDPEYREKVIKRIKDSWNEERHKSASISTKKSYVDNPELIEVRRNEMNNQWNNPEMRSKRVNGMKKVYEIYDSIEDKKYYFLGRQEVADFLGKSVSYAKTIISGKNKNKRYIVNVKRQ